MGPLYSATSNKKVLGGLSYNNGQVVHSNHWDPLFHCSQSRDDTLTQEVQPVLKEVFL
jgi:hypothetical protein